MKPTKIKPDTKLAWMAMEWATELGKFRGYELLVAEYTMWGFDEVERGRNPDVVLKEVLAKIEENKDRLQTNADTASGALRSASEC